MRRAAAVDRDPTFAYEGRLGVALVERALRHVVAFLFALALCLVVSVPALAAMDTFRSNVYIGPPTNPNLDKPHPPGCAN